MWLKGSVSCIVGLFVVCGIGAEEKVFVVPCTKEPPLIDGQLNEECWKNTDVIDDFMPLYALPLEPMKVRAVYDKNNIYFGIEILSASPLILHQKVKDIQLSKNFKSGFVHIREFQNLCSVEIFLDPQATLRNHYQILFNAAEQICGHYKYQWEDVFAVEPYGKSKMTESGWSAEVVIPRASLNNIEFRAGDGWGFNIARNDLQPVSIWKDVGPVFNTPDRFGRMVIGDYRSWWHAVWEEGVIGRFEIISREIDEISNPNQDIYNMYHEVQSQIEKEKQVKYDLSKRMDFLKAYRWYSNFYPLFHRFEVYYNTYKKII